MSNRKHVLNKLRNVAGRLKQIQKEISSMDVPGLELVREDLGIRRPKKQKTYYAHGQKHYQPRLNNSITLPSSGQGEHPEGIKEKR